MGVLIGWMEVGVMLCLGGSVDGECGTRMGDWLCACVCACV